MSQITTHQRQTTLSGNGDITPEWGFLIGFNLLFIQSSLLCNSALLFLLFRHRHKMASRLPIVFMVNLLVSQIIISLFSLITEMGFLFRSDSIHQVSIYTYKIYDSFLSTCNFSFAAINMDRYISVRHPLRYLVIMTPRKVFWISVSIFTFPGIILFIAFTMSIASSTNDEIKEAEANKQISFQVTGTLALVAMILTTIILVITNIYIYIVVIRHQRKTAAAGMSNNTVETNSSIEIANGGGTEVNQTNSVIDQNNNDNYNFNRNNSNRNNYHISGSNNNNNSMKQVRKNNRILINTVMCLSTSYVLLSVPEMVRLALALIGQSPEAPSRTVVMVADLTMNISFTLIPVSMTIRNKFIMNIMKRSLERLLSRLCKCGWN